MGISEDYTPDRLIFITFDQRYIHVSLRIRWLRRPCKCTAWLWEYFCWHIAILLSLILSYYSNPLQTKLGDNLILHCENTSTYSNLFIQVSIILDYLLTIHCEDGHHSNVTFHDKTMHITLTTDFELRLPLPTTTFELLFLQIWNL